MTLFGPRPLALLLALLLVPLLAACGGDGKADKPGPKKRPIPVAAAEASRRDLPVRLSAVGAVQAAAAVAVKSQVGGLIVRQYVRDGQEVKAGDLLFQIDPRPFAAAVAEAKARIERNTALLKKAEDDLARSAGLKDKLVISQEQYEGARTQAEALRADIRLGQAQLEKARLDLEFAAIRAPIAGVAGEIKVNEGNVIKANDDRDLVNIKQVRPIFVSFAVPEQYLPEIARRMRQGELAVAALAPGEEGSPAPGRLASLDNAVDRTTGTIRLKAEFPNADGRLWPGQFVRAELTLSVLKDAVTAPSAAVQTGIKGPFVFVVAADSTVEMRPVTPGLTENGFTVITQGLEAGEKVVTEGQLLLTPGAAVALKGKGGQPGQGGEGGEPRPGGKGKAPAGGAKP